MARRFNTQIYLFFRVNMKIKHNIALSSLVLAMGFPDYAAAQTEAIVENVDKNIEKI